MAGKDSNSNKAGAEVPKTVGVFSSSMPSEESVRSGILTEVDHIVNNNRNSQYGGAEDSFELIASYWSVYLTAKINGTSKQGSLPIVINGLDVAVMMGLLKTARITTNPLHYDSWVDTAGYAVCGAGIVVKANS